MRHLRSTLSHAGTPTRSITVALLGAVALLAGGACSVSATIGGSPGISGPALEEDLSQRVTTISATKPESVDCPNRLNAEVGATTTCEMVQEGVHVTLAITATKVAEDDQTLGFTWEVEPGSQRLLTNHVGDAIADAFTAKTGLTLTDMTCPEPELDGTAGTVMTCEAATTSGRTGPVVLTVTGAEGTRVDFSWRLGDEADVP